MDQPSILGLAKGLRVLGTFAHADLRKDSFLLVLPVGGNQLRAFVITVVGHRSG